MPIYERTLPGLAGWEPTRDSLHAYSKVIGAFARVLAEPNPQWWHVSLKLEQGILWTDELDPGGKRICLSMDLAGHLIQVHDPAGIVDAVDMRSRLTANEVAARIILILGELGLNPDLPQDKYANDAPRKYDPGAAQSYLRAIKNVFEVQSDLRSVLPGNKGPVQLWPHNFDQAFEWFSEKLITPEGAGTQSPAPAQINFGFAPGDATHPGPYFYSCPRPFTDALTHNPLPSGARWFDQGWKGSLLSYESLSGDPSALEKLTANYHRVFELASPSMSE